MICQFNAYLLQHMPSKEIVTKKKDNNKKSNKQNISNPQGKVPLHTNKKIIDEVSHMKEYAASASLVNIQFHTDFICYVTYINISVKLLVFRGRNIIK